MDCILLVKPQNDMSQYNIHFVYFIIRTLFNNIYFDISYFKTLSFKFRHKHQFIDEILRRLNKQKNCNINTRIQIISLIACK